MSIYPKNSAQTGFTLVEVVVVIAIIVVLMAMGVPSFQQAIASSKVRSTAESIRNGLQMARGEAVKLNANVTFTLSDDTSWTVGCTTPTATCPAVIAEKSPNEGSMGEITLVKTGDDDVIFTSLGITTAAAGQLSQVNITNSNVSDARNLRITIGSGGNAKVCDPVVTDPTDTRAC